MDRGNHINFAFLGSGGEKKRAPLFSPLNSMFYYTCRSPPAGYFFSMRIPQLNVTLTSRIIKHMAKGLFRDPAT